MKQGLFLAVMIITAFSPSAQNIQNYRGRNKPNSAINKETDLRLQRLNTLGDIWGNLAIHHPLLVGKEKEWDSVLTAAIPQIEKAVTTEEFVNSLNNSIFSYINDFFSYASILNKGVDTVSVHIKNNAFTVKKLTNDVI